MSAMGACRRLAIPSTVSLWPNTTSTPAVRAMFSAAPSGADPRCGTCRSFATPRSWPRRRRSPSTSSRSTPNSKPCPPCAPSSDASCPQMTPTSSKPVEEALMRIIAGAHKGARLNSPSGANTRPTADRVKESLFSMLDGYGVVPAANVLDLFAGSGGLGFEAMSRGAAQVDFVDSSLSSIRSLQANAKKLGLDHSADAHAGDVLQYLSGLPDHDDPESRIFDLVF